MSLDADLFLLPYDLGFAKRIEVISNAVFFYR